MIDILGDKKDFDEFCKQRNKELGCMVPSCPEGCPLDDARWVQKRCNDMNISIKSAIGMLMRVSPKDRDKIISEALGVDAKFARWVLKDD